ncbi:MAG: hypothetical protein RSB67_00025 [Clostridia bacterium]
MNKIHFFYNYKNITKSFKKHLNDFDIIIYDKQEKEKITNQIKISKENSLYSDYIKLFILYNYGGLVINDNFKILSKDFESLLNINDFMLSFDSSNEITTNIMWAKSPYNPIIKRLLEIIESNVYTSFKNLLEKEFYLIINERTNVTIKLAEHSYIMSSEYFYPIANLRINNYFTENTVIINKFRNLNFKEKLKVLILKKYGNIASRYLETVFNIIREKIGKKRYYLKRKFKKYDISYAKQKLSVDNAISVIIENKNAKYFIFHNPRWLGVTSATKELFENLVPLEEISKLKDAKRLAQEIIKSGVEQIIFSAFTDGWEMLAEQLKKLNENIKIKCYYHGSHSQVIESLNWKYNTDVILLHKRGIIDVIATCKESLMNFYISQGFNVAFIKNTVRLNEKLKEEIEDYKNNNKQSSIKIGVYAAGIDWRKNMYTQFAAASLVTGSKIETVSISNDVTLFASVHKFYVDGPKTKIDRTELLKKMATNKLNLYVTFSECAPMLLIESLEVGTICLSGDNHHYFKNTPLEKYLVVKREDDVISIYNKMLYALENEKEIITEYKKWKKDYDMQSEQSVINFLNM